MSILDSLFKGKKPAKKGGKSVDLSLQTQGTYHFGKETGVELTPEVIKLKKLENGRKMCDMWREDYKKNDAV